MEDENLTICIPDLQEKKQVRDKKKKNFFEIYISKVLKQVSSGNGISSNSKQQLNSVICIVAKTISLRAIDLTSIADKKTVSVKEVRNAVKILFTGELLKNSLIEGDKAVMQYNLDAQNKGSSRQDKAGIIFPPSITEKFLRNFGYSKIMISESAPIFLASILEYLASEILELSARSARKNKRNRLTIRDLHLSCITDAEISDLFHRLNIYFIGGGVEPCCVNTTFNSSRSENAVVRDIKKYQKMSDCLIIPKSPFETFVRSLIQECILHEYTEEDRKMKISKDVFTVLQYYLEQYIVGILQTSNSVCIHAGRVNLLPKDISFSYNIKNSSVSGFSASLQ